MNLGEAPVGVRSDDRRDELSKGEGEHEGERGTLHEEESMRTSDEDKGLGDDGNLEVHDHVKLRIVVVIDSGGSTVGESDTELVVEPSRADGDRNEGNPEHKYVSTWNKQ